LLSFAWVPAFAGMTGLAWHAGSNNKHRHAGAEPVPAKTGAPTPRGHECSFRGVTGARLHGHDGRTCAAHPQPFVTRAPGSQAGIDSGGYPRCGARVLVVRHRGCPSARARPRIRQPYTPSPRRRARPGEDRSTHATRPRVLVSRVTGARLHGHDGRKCAVHPQSADLDACSPRRAAARPPQFVFVFFFFWGAGSSSPKAKPEKPENSEESGAEVLTPE
jgi:hypothetical protein